MQLMPSTARLAAAEVGLAVLPDECVRPELNVQLGAHYLGKLFRAYGGTAALAAAAYNAGPHAVHAWLSSFTAKELDVWVATIPFRETRHYVAAVVANLVRYQYLAGGIEGVVAPTLTVPAAPALTDSDY
jgi:soluble lytic murein transglycosylase